MERDFKGIWIPKEVWLNKELKLIEKLFLVEIDSLDNEKGCWASNKYFADFFGITKGRCSQIINGLNEKGLIVITLKREGKEIKSRTIMVVNKLKGVVNKLNRVVNKCVGGYLINDKDNNTITNNTNNNKKNVRFKKPLIDDIKIYVIERGNLIDPQRFYDYYESNGWKVGRNKMKSWKACVRNWESRNEKTQSKVATRLSSHASAMQILKNMQNGN